jgi:hypothetical protein
VPVDDSLVGRSYLSEAPYDVTAQRVRDFRAATGGDAEPAVAPATFPIVVVFPLLEQLLADPDVGVPLRRVMHGDQRFSHDRQVQVGDRLSAVLTVRSVRRVAGNDLVALRAEVRDAAGTRVCAASTSLVHRSEDS